MDFALRTRKISALQSESSCSRILSCSDLGISAFRLRRALTLTSASKVVIDCTSSGIRVATAGQQTEMTSSLASQLSGIRSLNAARLASSSALSSQASYLFPPQTAARQDLDTVFALGETGWTELCSEDVTLERWTDGRSLFGPESKARDRTMLTKVENANIDTVVEGFFERIGAVLLSKSAGKCIEWLVRRFRVHEFNPLTTLQAFLPYHQSPQFARMLHILKISSAAHLKFLLPLQKTVQPLPTSVLVSALTTPPTSSPSLETLRFVAHLVRPGTSPHRTQVLFWSSILVQFCTQFAANGSNGESIMGLASNSKRARANLSEQSRKDNAQLVLTVVLPAAVAVVTDKSLGLEAQLAGCLVLCAIGANFDLSEDAVRSTVADIFSPLGAPKTDERLVKTILTSSAALYSGMGSELGSSLSTNTVRHALRVPSLSAELQSLSLKFNTQPFTVALSLGLVDSLQENGAAALLADLLSHRAATGGFPCDVLITLLNKVVEAKAAEQPAAAVLAAVRSERAGDFDAFLRSLAARDAAGSGNKLADKVLRLALGATSATEASGDALPWLSANGAEVSERSIALSSLFTAIDKGQIAPTDGTVRQTLSSRLLDDSIEVLRVLYSPQNTSLLARSLSADEILQKLESIMGASSTPDLEVFRAHVQFLMNTFLIENPKHAHRVFRNILWPRLLCTRENKAWGVAQREAILSHLTAAEGQVDLQPMSHLLQGVAAADGSSPLDRSNAAVVEGIARAVAAVQSDSHFTAHLSFLISRSTTKRSFSDRALALLVLSALLPQVDDARFSLIAWRFLDTHGDIAISKQPLGGSSRDIWQELYEVRIDSLQLLIEQSLIGIAENLRFGDADHGLKFVGLSSTDSAAKDDPLAIAEQLYRISSTAGSSFSDDKSVLSSLFLSLGDSVASFLCGICSSSRGSEDLAIVSAALKHLRALLSAYLADSQRSASDFQVIIPSLLIIAMNSDASIRREGLEALELVVSLAKSATQSKQVDAPGIWGYDAVYGVGSDTLMYLDLPDTLRFSADIVESKEPLANDHQYLPALLGGICSPEKGQDKKQSLYKRSVAAFLASHIVSWPSYKAKSRLLAATARIREPSRLSSLLPLLRAVVEAGEKGTLATHLLQELTDSEREEYVRLLFGLFDSRSKAAFDEPDGQAWPLLLRAIHNPETVVSKHAAPTLKTLWSLLGHERRKTAVEAVADVLADPASQAPSEVRETLASIDLDAHLLVTIFSELRFRLSAQGLDAPAVKRARGTATKRDTVTRSAAMLGEILEVCLRAKAACTAPVIAELFELLRVTLEIHLSRTLNSDYLLHLVLSNLGHALSGAMPTADVVQSLRVDTVVNVIKASKNPATFQQALLFLSSVAALAPELVLHSAMPIFTFVGSSVLQRDDAYSFTVVERVLGSIVPALVKSLRQQAQGAATGSKGDKASYFDLIRLSRPFLCIFTDAATHVPRHRRQTFFHHLVEILGPTDYAAPVAMLLTDRSAHKIARQERQQSSSAAGELGVPSQSLQLPLAVLAGQAAHVQLEAFSRIWDEVERLWASRASPATETEHLVFLDRLGRADREHSDSQTDATVQIVALLAMLRAAVSSPRFKVKARHLADKGQQSQNSYQGFVNAALRMMAVPNELIAESAQSALASIMPLVPITAFVSIVQELVTEEGDALRASGFSLLAERLPLLQTSEREQLADPIVAVLTTVKSNLAHASTRSAALSALRAIASGALPSEHSSLSATISPALDITESTTLPVGDRKQAFVAVQTMAGILGPRLLPHLQRIVKLCVTTAQSATTVSLRTIALQTLSTLVDRVASFMQTHLSSIIALATDELLNGQISKAAVASKALDALLSAVTKKMPSEQVLASVYETWDASRDDAVRQLGVLRFLQRFLRQVDRGSLSAQYKSVFRFVLRVLDQRRTNKHLSLDDVNAVENAAVQSFVKLVLKLNETTFRPLFLRVYDWAALDLAEDDMPVSDPGLVARRITLYKVNNALHDQLKGLVSHYYATMLDLTIELLAGFRSGKLENAELWTAVVASIDKSAQWDEGTFWNPTRLQKLAPALVRQLSGHNVRLLDNIDGVGAIRAALTPAVVHLALSVPDESSLKTLNSSLLDALRVDDAAVRVSALQVLTAMWSEPSLNSVLLGLVPETVPHIAELMESTETDVADATRAFVVTVEGVLGESLDSYLQ
ncbi:unnamed protein product [Parajaminaea phylloscopi]